MGRTFNIIPVEKEIDLTGLVRTYYDKIISEGLNIDTLPSAKDKAQVGTPVQPVRP